MTDRAFPPTSDIEIVPFSAEHGAAFYALNRVWLDAHALYEPPDEAQLADPQSSILARGGAVFIALQGEQVLGTAAVIPHGPGEKEIVKLTVAEPARGRGLGRALAERCLAFARDHHAERVVLVSSTRLGAALALYESLGFAHRPLPAVLPYETADVYMELSLSAVRTAS